MFVIFFACFIFVFTVRENIYLGIIALILLFLCICIRQKLHHSSRRLINKKLFLGLTVAFILGLGSRLLFNVFSGHVDFTDKTFSGTGVIEDTYTEGKYIFSDGKFSYVLYSQKEYTIGNRIFLSGKKSSGAFSGTTTDQGFLAFDYVKWLKMKGWKGVIYERNSFLMHDSGCMIHDDGCGTQKNLGIGQIKKDLQQKIISLYGENRISGLILGMLIGDRSQIPKGDYQNFTSSGLVHLIAVSGGNIVMITVFLGFLFFFIPFYLRSGLILLCIIFYGLLCGLDSSVFRAVLTGGLSLLALFRGREVPIWRLLSIAFVAMLLINPYYLVYDVGFILSFGAVIGIIIFNQKYDCTNKIFPEYSGTGMTKKGVDGRTEHFGIAHKGIKYIRKNYLQPSVGATIGVFPIIIFFMNKINLLSVFGNLFVLPIIPLVMIYGFLSLFFYPLFHRKLLLTVEEILITYIYKISELSSSHGIYLRMDGWVKWVVLASCVFAFAWWRVVHHHPGADLAPGWEVD